MSPHLAKIAVYSSLLFSVIAELAKKNLELKNKYPTRPGKTVSPPGEQTGWGHKNHRRAHLRVK